MLKVQIESGGKQSRKAKVNSNGELAVSPADYDEITSKEVGTANVATNFFSPQSGKQFLITGMRGRADRDVSPTADATVVIYEAGADDTTSVDKVILTENLVRGESFSILPINVLVAEGKFINAKTTDDDIFITIIGRFIEKVT